MAAPIITPDNVKELAAPSYLGDHAALVLAEPGAVTLTSVFSGRPVLAVRGDIHDLTDQSDWENGTLRDPAAKRVALYLSDLVIDRMYAGGWYSTDEGRCNVGELVGELQDCCPTGDFSDTALRVVFEGEPAELDWRVSCDDDVLTLVVRRRRGV